jgi:DNA mismatch endonuclease, patch repair protein
MPKLPPVPRASSPSTRKTMQANRGKNTGPELELRRLLRQAGCPGYRLHWKKAPGHPDIAYPGRKVAIFVNGCFWHRCPQCDLPMPKSNTEFWNAKFTANRERDARKTTELEAAGWTVVTVWECQVRDDPAGVASDIHDVLFAAK